MSDEKYKVADAWSLDDANVKEFKEKMKKKLMEIQDGKCAYCGASIDLIKKTEFEIDHFL